MIILSGLIKAAIAPTFIGLVYLFIRDKYEKEPYAMLFFGLLYGLYATFIIFTLGVALERLYPHEETAFFSAFIASAGIEEFVKFLILYFLVWKNRNFNEPFDGIVYSVFISLGFAMLENIIYVTHEDLGGYGTALARALFSVPGHGLFGVQMGYYFALAKFNENKKYLWLSFIVPYLLHGLYNYILFLQSKFIFIPFIMLVIFLWYIGLKRMKELLLKSPFKRLN